MIYHDTSNVSEGIKVNKANELKECDVRRYCDFLNKVFKFQTYVCNGCHNLLLVFINLDDIAILNINSDDYRDRYYYQN